MYQKRDSVQSALSDGQRESVGRRGIKILSIITLRDCSDDLASFARVYELSCRRKANVPKNVTFWQPLSTSKMEVIIIIPNPILTTRLSCDIFHCRTRHCTVAERCDLTTYLVSHY